MYVYTVYEKMQAQIKAGILCIYNIPALTGMTV